MPNESLDEALKEVYTLAPTNSFHIDTLEISHPSLVDVVYMVRNIEPMELTLENASTVTFEPVPFRFIPPASGTNGAQEMTIAIDNVDRRISDFIEAVGTDSKDPVMVKYRVYLSNAKSGPQNAPPLVLFLTDLKINAFEVTGRATFTGIINKPYPNQFYDRERFPGLGG